MIKDFFPFKVILNPSETFAGFAAGATGWRWPLGLYALSIACSSFMLSVLPPQFLAASFEGLTLPPVRSFWVYFLLALPGALLFSLFTCGLLSLFTVFLRTGRLSARLALCGLGVGIYGLLALALHDPAGLRPLGLAAALAAAALSSWAALRDKNRYRAMLKTLLALAAIGITSELAAGAAVLAGSVETYTAFEYFFSLLSLVWLVKGAGVVYDMETPRAASAVVLAMLGATAFLFLLLNLKLLPAELFQVLLLS